MTVDCSLLSVDSKNKKHGRRQEDNFFDGRCEQDHSAFKTDFERHLFVILLWSKNRYHRFERIR